MSLNKILYRTLTISLLLISMVTADLNAQAVPGKDENIYCLVTFGKDGKTSWGDPNFHSVWFFHIPPDYKKPFYIRVFDPDCGGEYDEIQGEFNTKTLFSIFGGKLVDPEQNTESQGVEKGKTNYKKGNLLASKIFGSEAKYDNKYFTFGPFNTADGDFSAKWTMNVFKIVCEGVQGDDGNLYRYFLSSDPNSNIPVEGANAFTYSYTFRMWNDFKSIAHIYPFIDKGVAKIKQENFDWDNDGKILVVSRYRVGDLMNISNEDDTKENTFGVDQEKEVGSSLDFQFHKSQGVLVKNNNVQIQLSTQDNKGIKFFSSPIGGVPKYDSAVGREPLKPVKK